MSSRGRRILFVLAALALVLSLGRWGALFLAERLWEGSVSESAALAGARRALFGLGLELAGLVTGVLWCLVNWTPAARIALPDRAAPEPERSRACPAQVPRWALPVAATVLGILAGSGAGAWRDEVLLALDGARMGVTDPLIGIDLGQFAGAVPLRLHLQAFALRLTLLALAGVLMLHLAGRTIRLVERRIWVSPRARGHLALLLALLALVLAWGRALEQFRLAVGESGPVLPSAFLLARSVAAVQAGLGAGAAVVTFLWWLRLRGVVAAAIWGLFGVGLLAGELVPLRSTQAVADAGWRASARRLDSVSFGLSRLEEAPLTLRPAEEIEPALWDRAVIPSALGLDTSSLASARRGMLPRPDGSSTPAWFAIRSRPGPALIAVDDAVVSPTGRALLWRARDSLPSPGDVAFRVLSANAVRPRAPRVAVGGDVPGVQLETWSRRLVLAWALQSPEAFRAPRAARVGWRLEPVTRLQAIAPFATWEPARPRVIDDEVVWVSVGVLNLRAFPASIRVTWQGQSAGFVRPSLVGLVSAETGAARIFRRDPADSLAAAWARVAAPLIEPPAGIPVELRSGIGPSETAASIRARVLEGPAWGAGRLGAPRGVDLVAPIGVGNGALVSPFLRAQACEVEAILVSLPGFATDSMRLIAIDSSRTVECPSTLTQRWERFPFSDQLRDSVEATGASFERGIIRYQPAAEGLIAYQPAYAIPPGGGRAALVMVSVALGRRLGAGRSLADAWRNLRGEISPMAPGAGSDRILEEARRWMRHADSALARGDLQELGRALQYLRELLEPPGRPPPR